MSPDPIIDDDNPEWTDADFARAQKSDTLPPEILAAFPRTARGAKAKVSVAISADVVRSFQAAGADWEDRIDEVLRKAIAA
jgi:uncharacterized protein (DUF4415 family)